MFLLGAMWSDIIRKRLLKLDTVGSFHIRDVFLCYVACQSDILHNVHIVLMI